MHRKTLPCAVLMALVAAAAAQPAAALPPLRAEVVDDATLGAVSGKFYGANLLVGLRIDLVSTLSSAQSGSNASAGGSLLVRNTGQGFEVQVDSRSSANVGSTPPALGAPPGLATGAEGLQIGGIGQVSQIAGDGNRLDNLTTIRFVPESTVNAADTAHFNGQTTSQASAGPMTAHITFTGGGVQLGLTGAGASLAQQLQTAGGSGQLLQLGQIAGNGMVGRNQLQLQLLTREMTTQTLHQLGVQQALAGLGGLGR